MMVMVDYAMHKVVVYSQWVRLSIHTSDLQSAVYTGLPLAVKLQDSTVRKPSLEYLYVCR